MTNSVDLYHIEQRPTSRGIMYFFMSAGTEDIIKVVEYSFVQPFDGRDIYNLGFGDYDIGMDRLSDDQVSNNGDHYRVFNTVLSTIPAFFSHYPLATLSVQGSDSKEDYIQQCKTNCNKSCGPQECRNAHRRIRIYRNYVDRHFERLGTDYFFQGGHRNTGNQIFIEPYQVGKAYDSVLVSIKNNVSLRNESQQNP